MNADCVADVGVQGGVGRKYPERRWPPDIEPWKRSGEDRHPREAWGAWQPDKSCHRNV